MADGAMVGSTSSSCASSGIMVEFSSSDQNGFLKLLIIAKNEYIIGFAKTPSLRLNTDVQAYFGDKMMDQQLLMLRWTCVLFLLYVGICGGEGVDFNSPFSNIYSQKTWNPSGGPLSGMGSDACRYIRYLLLLQHVVDMPEIKHIVEIGFGDFQMNQHIIFQGKHYRGYDVVQSIMRQSEYNTEFHLLHDLKQIQKGGDLLITKDAMQHWPNSEVKYLIDVILPKFKYALLTNDMMQGNQRQDISPGGHAPIPVMWLPHSQEVLSINDDLAHVTKATYLYKNPNNA